jgi:Iron only hydrogenase large subunit, C-terminal domain
MLKAMKISPRNITVTTDECDSDGYGRGFAMSGGVSRAVNHAIEELGLDIALKEIQCNGIEECKKHLTIASKTTGDFNFIEGMSCVDGCVGGPCCINPSGISKKAMGTASRRKE